MNSVIHYLTETLQKNYSAKRVLGVQGGFAGFDADSEPIELSSTSVYRLQHQGGTLLGTSRGGFDLDKIMAFLCKYEVRRCMAYM